MSPRGKQLEESFGPEMTEFHKAISKFGQLAGNLRPVSAEVGLKIKQYRSRRHWRGSVYR